MVGGVESCFSWACREFALARGENMERLGELGKISWVC